jgi:hypothetical protein
LKDKIGNNVRNKVGNTLTDLTYTPEHVKSNTTEKDKDIDDGRTRGRTGGTTGGTTSGQMGGQIGGQLIIVSKKNATKTNIR